MIYIALLKLIKNMIIAKEIFKELQKDGEFHSMKTT